MPIDCNLRRTEITNRVRLEQRFINQEGENVFAQRFRFYTRVEIPIVVNKNFSEGLFAGIQNEIFLNVQNKEEINNRFFDQNRIYGGLGYRFSKKLQAEAGYLYHYPIEKLDNLNNHILQESLYSDL